jgi:hypothetical protein
VLVSDTFPETGPAEALAATLTEIVPLAEPPLCAIVAVEPKVAPSLATSKFVGAVTVIFAVRFAPVTLNVCAAEAVPAVAVKGFSVPVVLIVGPVPPLPAAAMNLMLSKRLFPLADDAPEKVTRTKALAAASRPVTVGNESTPVLANVSRIVPAVEPPEIVAIGDHVVPLPLYSQTWDENPVLVLWAANVI